MTHIDLFSGIGGFALAAKWAGFETIAFCEIDPFCQRILKRRFNGEIVTDTLQSGWGNRGEFRNLGKTARQKSGGGDKSAQTIRNCATAIPIIPDIRNLDGNQWRGATLLTGGFPCQPFSCAGKRKGREDDRHLWPEMLRVIADARPTWVVGENVVGIVRMELDQVCLDLEAIGYSVQPVVIPACAVNAPHRRDRVWILAHTENPNGGRSTDTENAGRWTAKVGGPDRGDSDAPDAPDIGFKQPVISANSQCRSWQGGAPVTENATWDRPWLEVAPELCGVDDGLPVELDGFKLSKSRHRVERLKALGNAIVPQVAYQILRAIAEIENGGRENE